MTQYITLNIELPNSLLNRLKSAIKNGAKVTLNLTSNVSGNSYDKTNFPHELLLANTHIFRLSKAFVNNWSANIKLSKTQLSKIVHSLNNERIPCIPPVINDNKFLTDFSKKADLFNSLFTKTKLMKNGTSVFDNNIVLLSSTNPTNDKYLSNNEFTKGNIERIT